MTKRRDSVQSLVRGLAVLRALGDDHAPLSISDVAGRTGLSRATARRLLLTLVDTGYVHSDEHGFRLGARVLDLAHPYLTDLGRWAHATPAIEALSRELGESCSIAVLDGAEIVYVARAQQQRLIRTSVEIGTRLPAALTALGRVLLAGLSETRARQLLETSADPAPLALERLLGVLRTVRSQGYAVIDQELERGLVAFAVPIRDEHGRTVAALGVSSHTGRVTARELACRFERRLAEAAHDVARA